MPGAIIRTGSRQSLRRPLLASADLMKRAALRWDPAFKALGGGPPGPLEALGPYAAMRAALLTLRKVPAYRDFVFSSGWRDDPSLPARERLASLPVTDKANYIDAYPVRDRCIDGRLPMKGVEIDESSGSSGKPYSWVRSRKELHEVHLMLSQLAGYLFGEKNFVAINCFSMGAWATGVNASHALAQNGILKSPGPDPEKALSVFDLLGTDYTYLVIGYPPFLKELLEFGEKKGFDWSRFKMYGVVGGEAMSELLRAQLEKRFIGVASAYGASDLDIGVATEMPLSIWIRKRAFENRELDAALFGEDSRLPMMFQYNPIDYHIEVNELEELIITVNRASMLSPRIRYNIHDAGSRMTYDQVIQICRDFGLDPVKSSFASTGIRAFKLPFLFVRGRADSTISYMGANIYPEDVEIALFIDSEDATRLGAFCLELVERDDASLRPCVHVEVVSGSVDDSVLAERLAERVRNRLLANNRDFKAAVAEDPAVAQIQVRLHGPGSGPFVENSRRIKRRYVIPQAVDPKVSTP